ncbi:MAG: hypothetical protein WBL68_10610 [Nitrososphaeraceae archaeon]|nr:hypothetical protein [Nitrososphaeraceae archaeon]
MVVIETTSSLESFRKFIIVSTCRSFIPESYLKDFEVFPEREEGPGAIYIEAADKVTLKRIREMTFVNAKEILGIIYSSKSGNTRLKWRQTRKKIGKVQGDASSNALVNMVESGVLTQEWVDNYLRASHSRKTSQNIDQPLPSAPGAAAEPTTSHSTPSSSSPSSTSQPPPPSPSSSAHSPTSNSQ